MVRWMDEKMDELRDELMGRWMNVEIARWGDGWMER